MRQAGRSLPEYRKLRERWTLVDIVAQPELCAEVTLQPVRRLGVDAAVMFADIMLPLRGMGVEFDLVENVGPVIARPIASAADIARLAVPPGEAAAPLPRVILRDAWRAARNTGPGYTWSNDNPFAAAGLDLDRRIDHVMVGQPKLGGVGHVLAAHIAGNVPIDGMWGSDHLAVVAELRY